MSRMDEYIRKAARESTTIPEEKKKEIRSHFIAMELRYDNRRYYCPVCNMPTPKISRYCCNCGQKVSLEKPVIACLD